MSTSMVPDPQRLRVSVQEAENTGTFSGVFQDRWHHRPSACSLPSSHTGLYLTEKGQRLRSTQRTFSKFSGQEAQSNGVSGFKAAATMVHEDQIHYLSPRKRAFT